MELLGKGATEEEAELPLATIPIRKVEALQDTAATGLTALPRVQMVQVDLAEREGKGGRRLAEQYTTLEPWQLQVLFLPQIL